VVFLEKKRVHLVFSFPFTIVMARGIEGNEIATPKPQLKKSTSSLSASQSQSKQKSILGFFQKKTGAAASPSSSTVKPSPALDGPSTFTQAPSSDVGDRSSPPLVSSPIARVTDGKNKENGMAFLVLPRWTSNANTAVDPEGPHFTSSPPRKVRHSIEYL